MTHKQMKDDRETEPWQENTSLSVFLPQYYVLPPFLALVFYSLTRPLAIFIGKRCVWKGGIFVQ